MDENKIKEINAGNGKNRLMVFFIIMLLLIAASLLFTRIQPLTGFTVLENAEVMAGKETYYIGDMAHLFVFPANGDYEIEVYDPDNNLYSNALNFPVEKLGTYTVKVI